ncbi:hypothetical protein [Aestuariivirga litoralis]|uniref:hypothetical protein n=1 Tax=Aestuariivirga litoralis TaxID=2650924 RepID=UPI0018C45C45|nr:hypothetical protein [Aestuariivirga litoralis]MBG1233910.1 hypothetical protein [Aestuariivirga litoralis]
MAQVNFEVTALDKNGEKATFEADVRKQAEEAADRLALDGYRDVTIINHRPVTRMGNAKWPH